MAILFVQFDQYFLSYTNGTPISLSYISIHLFGMIIILYIIYFILLLFYILFISVFTDN